MKSKLRLMYSYFTLFEKILLTASLLVMTASYIVFKGSGTLSFIASLIGAFSLIFCAKGNPVGQLLIIIFSMIYAFISYRMHYYGEMVTYATMTAPMAAASLYVWLKNPYGKSRAQVRVRSANGKELAAIILITIPVTVAFYFILDYFGTANIVPSTLSVATSFLAVALTFRRCALYAVAYAMNDVILIVLWLLASIENTSYVPMLTCFAVFLVNDIYGFINWNRLLKQQSEN
ncbi:nicotinamide riboside transporter PnuC [Ruminococcus sp. FC2018]|uniref:nicotinamide riboside transporter PnuC n=1 Tax=Ruminococcus sp. FC2018 TaxID=1410617 RepID=UPI000491EEFA|nr:nicotinamide riboside transporter PnuC [Ruminococcus sp. FC2018]